MRRLHRLLIALATALPLAASDAFAQASEHELKAAFIYNFVKFAQWPDSAMRGGTINICASPGTLLYSALQGLGGKAAHGKALAVLPLPSSAAGECHVVVATGTDREHRPLLRRLSAGPVLAVTDDPEMMQDGMMIGMVVESGRIHFTIDNTRATEAGLVVSSRLLRLARSVR